MEAGSPKPTDKKPRKCLRCLTKFQSIGPENRICRRCRTKPLSNEESGMDTVTVSAWRKEDD